MFGKNLTNIIMFQPLSDFTHTLHSMFIRKMYKKGLLPSANKRLRHHNSHSKLLEKNDPKHTSKISKRFKVDNSIKLLAWPVQSPDWNPIGNIWAVIKLEIWEEQPTSADKLVKQLKKELKYFSIDFAEKLVDSMTNSVIFLIERRWDYINS